MQAPAIFLVDNGSLRPEATFALRRLAQALGRVVGREIEAVSLLHSHKIPAEELNGQPATIVKRRMRELFKAGQREFVILPLFLGPSLAITDYLPRVVEELRGEQPGLSVKIAEPIAGADVDEPDYRLAQMLEDHIRPLLDAQGDAKLALVDHGTPIKPVNRLRDAVAGQLARRLNQSVQPCSMERRDGPEYAFNDPLLENLATIDGYSGQHLVLAMFFLLPGRHAGEGGDVAEIADNLVEQAGFKSVRVSPLIGEHPLLLEILKQRLKQVVD
ncbi:cobalamin biosynthesis protein CbiX [Coraliomargarita sinensis]|uniref:Cobalamin biosynthesis protein CbiX n=1 Tax=Coraliomargarita sinensis TaxID=2174842 RepID=A0A317ZGV0_9BACT|nr:CbiX/SirB N-terminal domain-containing protein [Coraliomargarita sinensis]PXA02999.1 cobalamin biosynthesis protein CbiX [Coraliomargarita sinensis]